MEIHKILNTELIKFGDNTISVYHILMAIMVLIGARLLILFIRRTILNRFFRKRNVDVGRQYTIVTLLKYVIYTMAVLGAMQVLGIQLSVLLGGAAALLVGIGLGLQQTFNDLVSGIILLSEGTVEVGDILSIDGTIGTVSSIGIRTSKVETRDEISIIIPNSKLVVNNVINLSHNKNPTRFQVKVGVAYASDVELVTALLLQAAKSHKDVLKRPEPRVQFKDFGNSSLDFELHFYTNQFLRIEFIKSDIRFKIAELFRKNGVEIPFPQQDVWLRNAVNVNSPSMESKEPE
ncbi:MAG: mechanosensitive ion channel [Saprospiraceae bacterium]